MANKFKKGDKVFMFRMWDGAFTAYFQELTIEAFGEKVVRATFSDNGEFIKAALSPDADFVLVSECADPIARAIEHAKAFQAKQLAYWTAFIGHPGRNQQGVLKRIEQVKMAPRAISYEQGKAEVAAALRAWPTPAKDGP